MSMKSERAHWLQSNRQNLIIVTAGFGVLAMLCLLLISLRPIGTKTPMAVIDEKSPGEHQPTLALAQENTQPPLIADSQMKPAPDTPEDWTTPNSSIPQEAASKDWGPHGPPIIHNSEVASLANLVADSDRIVVGWVVDQVCRWNDDRTAIYTYYRFAVDRVLKGDVLEDFVTVRVIGGSIPEEEARLTVSHQPRFTPGDKGIVFLDDNPILWTSVSYNQQGFLRFDDRGPDLRLVIDGFDRPVYGLSDDDRFIIQSGHTNKRVNSTDIEERIQTLAG